MMPMILSSSIIECLLRDVGSVAAVVVVALIGAWRVNLSRA